jgi:hypothetical protein
MAAFSANVATVEVGYHHLEIAIFYAKRASHWISCVHQGEGGEGRPDAKTLYHRFGHPNSALLQFIALYRCAQGECARVSFPSTRLTLARVHRIQTGLFHRREQSQFIRSRSSGVMEARLLAAGFDNRITLPVAQSVVSSLSNTHFCLITAVFWLAPLISLLLRKVHTSEF